MQYGFKDAIAKVGLNKFMSDLFWIGMFYHLYNQVKQSTRWKGVLDMFTYLFSYSDLHVTYAGGYKHIGKGCTSNTCCRKCSEASVCDRVLHRCLW